MRFDPPKLQQQFRTLLRDGIVPFWFRHGVDHEYGGVLSCMAEDGTPISTDKYTWSQARFIWSMSALFNRVERRPEFLESARHTIEFLLAHARDEAGWLVYRTTREGTPLEVATSIYSDCFFVYGLSEYCRASSDSRLLAFSVELFWRITKRVEHPDFRDTAPYTLLPGRKIHGIPMILTEVANELAETTHDPAIAAAADCYANCVMTNFVKPERRLLLEFLDADYSELPGNEGSYVMPGHALESMWFNIHCARRRSDPDGIRRAVEVIRWHLEAGWDQEYGGLFLGIDANGGCPFLPNSEKKIWWPHTEALYALLLAYRLTGQPWCLEWYERVHEWSFQHFPMTPDGEWFQRLDRQGNPTRDLIALPVKDPFHLARAVILILDLLDNWQPR
ncbi:MAG: AGE family epimerase/isomerase [Acidobacteriota bacterium]|nr:AGE family epimerase/isomerase [Acidobacteriota bacterium]